MAHPNVLKLCGIDPDEWQGFAGAALSRVTVARSETAPPPGEAG